MRKPQDFDGELKALQDKARNLKSRKVLGLGELVIATGADSLSADRRKSRRLRSPIFLDYRGQYTDATARVQPGGYSAMHVG